MRLNEKLILYHCCRDTPGVAAEMKVMEGRALSWDAQICPWGACMGVNPGGDGGVISPPPYC